MNDSCSRTARARVFVALGLAALIAAIGCGPGSGGDRCGQCLDGCMNSPDPDGCIDFCAKSACRGEARAEPGKAAPAREETVAPTKRDEKAERRPEAAGPG